MGLVKVWNDNEFSHVEEFRSQKIEIAPHTFIEMDEDEALQFKSQFKAPILDGGGNHDPRGFKKIRIEAPPKKAVFHALTNPLTGKVCASQEELADQIKEARHLLLLTNPTKEVEDDSDLRKQVAEQSVKIGELTELLDAMLSERKKGK